MPISLIKQSVNNKITYNKRNGNVNLQIQLKMYLSKVSVITNNFNISKTKFDMFSQKLLIYYRFC